DAAASPRSGTTATHFQLSVRYVSPGGNPAKAVTAQAGPVTVDLALATGTPLDGTWSGVTLLPAGTWPVSFAASAARGPDPTLVGPSLAVAAPATVATPAPTRKPSAGEAGDEPSSAPSLDAQPSSRGDRPSPDARPHDGPPASDHAAPETPVPAPASSDGERSSTGDTRPRRSTKPAGTASPAAERPRSEADRPTPTGSHAGPVGEDQERDLRGLLLLLGAIVSVATVALVGTGWLLAARERRGDAEPTPEGGRALPRRRATPMPPADDPVLAALGLDRDDDAPADPRRGSLRRAAPRPPRDPRR
ncbi:MAG TPA: hypothetical protein VHK63_08340, partial [Candidatus Limnocylindria bacterium]|nr:hypothetical protein [Candidatus Limnocylindria bacterium]